MNTTGNERLRELLAAEYVLGTLRGGARRRLERWLGTDAGLQALVSKWSDHLAAFAESIPGRAPPPRVWEAIVARIPALRSGTAPRPNWWDSLTFWRGLAVATTVAAVFAIGVDATRDSRPIVAQKVAVLPGLIGTINDQKTGLPLVVLMLSSEKEANNERGNELVVKLAEGVEVPSGRTLQLWMSPQRVESGAPEMVSLGLVGSTDRTVSLKLATDELETLRTAKAIGLSMEPAGGSPQPTQVMGLGKWTRLVS